MPVEGECAKVPGRDNFDPNEFGVSIYSVSGQRINFGSVRNPITLQAITAVTSFLIAQDTVGEDNLPIGSEPSGKMYNDMTMLKAALDAFIKEDPSIVELTRASRHKVHVLRDGAVEELMKNSSPTSLQDLTTAKLFASMWILRHLSRISDHVLNLAEKIAFIATGISPLTMKKKGKKDTVNTRTINLGM